MVKRRACEELIRAGQTEDKAISLATCSRNRLKGMRRRAAKLLTCIRADSFEYQSPDMQASGDPAGDVTVELERLTCQLQSSMTESSSAGQSQHTSCNAVLACVPCLHVTCLLAYRPCLPSLLVCHACIHVVIDLSHLLTNESGDSIQYSTCLHSVRQSFIRVLHIMLHSLACPFSHVFMPEPLLVPLLLSTKFWVLTLFT